MRLLYITPSFQHPSMRGPTRCYHFIKHLSKGHRITLLSLTRSEVSPSAMKEMASYTERILVFDSNRGSNSHASELVGKLPWIGGRLKRSLQLRDGVNQMKKVFSDLARQECYDVVLFHGKSVFPVIDGWNGLPIVVDFCDASSMRILTSMQHAGVAKLPLRILRYLQVRQVERKLIKKTPNLAFVSSRDREAILGAGNKAEVIPIGVDLHYWKRKSNHFQPNSIVFTGVMNYGPNEDAALYLIERILPLLRRRISDLEVLIVGRDPSSALIKKARCYDRVTVTGFVDDLRPYLERAAVFAAPLRYGAGIQNKILEAMAMEVPVVTTPLVAAGLRVDDGEPPPVVVAEEEGAFAESIVKLLGQEEERSRLAAAGRQFVENYFTWSHSAEKLEKMCLAAAGINGLWPETDGQRLSLNDRIQSAL